MSRQVLWNRVVLEEFLRLANLTPDEEKIMRTRLSGWTIQRQSMELGMSVSSVNRSIRHIKQVYDAVQPYSTILPKRVRCASEL